MATTLKLQFLTKTGDKVYYNIAYPSPGVDPTEIEEVMDAFISKNIFLPKTGELTAKVKAEEIITTTTIHNFEADGE